MQEWFKICICYILFFSSNSIYSQYKIAGKVFDANTRQPIPFANIVVVHTQIGTVSDIDGNFLITVKKLPVQLQVSYIGYQTKFIEVSKPEESVKILLTPQTIELPELTIKAGENPAHRIVRKVVEMRARNNPEQLNSFQYISYNKLYFTIDRKQVFYTIDTIKVSKEKTYRYPKLTDSLYNKLSQQNFISNTIDTFFNKTYLFLSESVSKRYFKYPDNNKEIILSTRTSGLQQPYFVLLATQFQSFSFYSDFVTIFEKKYLNPLSNQAIGRYFYEITDTLYSENSDTIFVIQFRPLKNALFDGLKGTMHIHTRNYAIQAIKAEPAKQQNLFNVRIQQLYSLIDSIQWFPTQLNTDLKYKAFSFQDKTDTLQITDTTLAIIKKTISLIGVGKSYLDSISINNHIPKKTFNTVSIELLADAHRSNDTVWAKYRKESFGTIEQNTYTIIDSIGKEIKLDKKIQFLEYLLNGFIPLKIINLGISNLFDFNRFEGFRVNADVQTNHKVSPYLSVGGYLGYAFYDKKTKYGTRLHIKPYRYNDLQLTFSTKEDTREIGEVSFFDDKSLINSESFRRIYINNMDYHKQYSTSFIFRTFRYFKSQIHLSDNTFKLSQPNYFYMNDSLNTTLHFREAWLGIKFLYKEQFFQTLKGRYSLGSKYPSVFFNVHFGKVFSFTDYYWKSECKIRIPIDWGLAGKTNITLISGYTPSDLPKSLLYNGKGTKFMDIMIYAENTFATMYVNEFFYHSFLFSFLKHDLGKILFKIGSFQPGISLHHNMGIGNLHNTNLFQAKTTHKLYTESGLHFYGLIKQSFNSFGIGIFYRYGNYAFAKFKDNVAIKISVSYTFQ